MYIPQWYEISPSKRNLVQEHFTDMRLETLVASVAEKDAQIAELKKRPTLDQVRDARAGSIVLTVAPDGNNITLGMTIEQSDNLVEWTSLDGEMTRTIPIPDGKKFYRFAFDK